MTLQDLLRLLGSRLHLVEDQSDQLHSLYTFHRQISTELNVFEDMYHSTIQRYNTYKIWLD